MVFSLAQKILKSKRTVVLFHTWTVTGELRAQAIREKRSMDLDVCVDDSGNAYLGHPKEYHDKTMRLPKESGAGTANKDEA
jgi:hypothetical protein